MNVFAKLSKTNRVRYHDVVNIKYRSRDMLRSRSFLSLKALRGCPPVKPKSYPVVHAAQRPAKSSNINFAELGLRFQVTRDPTISTSTLIWSAPPVDPPSLPFMVLVAWLVLIQYGVSQNWIDLQVSRAGRSQGIPVYTEYKSGGTRMVTILKKCRGDIKVSHDTTR